jgi:hypothetical protein
MATLLLTTALEEEDSAAAAPPVAGDVLQLTPSPAIVASAGPGSILNVVGAGGAETRKTDS